MHACKLIVQPAQVPEACCVAIPQLSAMVRCQVVLPSTTPVGRPDHLLHDRPPPKHHCWALSWDYTCRALLCATTKHGTSHPRSCIRVRTPEERDQRIRLTTVVACLPVLLILVPQQPMECDCPPSAPISVRDVYTPRKKTTALLRTPHTASHDVFADIIPRRSRIPVRCRAVTAVTNRTKLPKCTHMNTIIF